MVSDSERQMNSHSQSADGPATWVTVLGHETGGEAMRHVGGHYVGTACGPDRKHERELRCLTRMRVNLHSSVCSPHMNSGHQKFQHFEPTTMACDKSCVHWRFQIWEIANNHATRLVQFSGLRASAASP